MYNRIIAVSELHERFIRKLCHSFSYYFSDFLYSWIPDLLRHWCMNCQKPRLNKNTCLLKYWLYFAVFWYGKYVFMLFTPIIYLKMWAHTYKPSYWNSESWCFLLAYTIGTSNTCGDILYHLDMASCQITRLLSQKNRFIYCKTHADLEVDVPFQIFGMFIPCVAKGH